MRSAARFGFHDPKMPSQLHTTQENTRLHFCHGLKTLPSTSLKSITCCHCSNSSWVFRRGWSIKTKGMTWTEELLWELVMKKDRNCHGIINLIAHSTEKKKNLFPFHICTGIALHLVSVKRDGMKEVTKPLSKGSFQSKDSEHPSSKSDGNQQT